MYFLYMVVPKNQLCSRCELLAKQKAVNKKNGTVGRIGRMMPTTPSARLMQPSAAKNIFFIDRGSFLLSRGRVLPGDCLFTLTFKDKKRGCCKQLPPSRFRRASSLSEGVLQ